MQKLLSGFQHMLCPSESSSPLTLADPFMTLMFIMLSSSCPYLRLVSHQTNDYLANYDKRN